MKRAVFLLFLYAPLFAAPKEVTLFLTSNLAGRFPLDQNLEANQLLHVGAYIKAQKEKNPAAYHFDLGNAFYPGRLSRFSFGSLTADYLQMLRLDAGVVAAGDLNIGAESLDYIRRARGIRLLSANIFRDKNAYFEPFATFSKAGLKLSVVGVTSTRTLVSYAEAQTLDLRLGDPEISVQAALAQLDSEKPELTIALAGVQLGEATALLGKNPGLDLVIAGGDARGTLGKENVRSVEIADGRRVLVLPHEATLLKVTLRKSGKRWAVADHEIVDVFADNNPLSLPPSFARRLALWQKWYAAESADSRSEGFSPFKLTHEFAAAAVRDAWGCDVAVLEEEDVDIVNFGPITRPSEIRYAVQNDYNIFTVRASGPFLRSYFQKNPQLVFSGMTGEAITGYPIRDNVNYRVCATERGYEHLSRQMEKRATAESQWLGISDAVTRAVEERNTDPGGAADRRFRFLTVLNLSNTYETGRVSNTAPIDTPPGQPADSYFKWGLENDVNFILYNRRHAISFNPYIFYVRQNDQIIRNLLRGDVTYVYNTEWFVKPYQKNRIDTLVVPVDGQRPSFLRETVGAEFSWRFFTGRLGGGMEKEILDPVNAPNWGIEANVAALWEFIPGIKYKLGFDSFSSRTYQNFWRHRVDVANSLIFTIVNPLTFTVSHRWYYFYLESVQNFYNSSILLLSLDLRTTWKYP